MTQREPHGRGTGTGTALRNGENVALCATRLERSVLTDGRVLAGAAVVLWAGSPCALSPAKPPPGRRTRSRRQRRSRVEALRVAAPYSRAYPRSANVGHGLRHRAGAMLHEVLLQLRPCRASMQASLPKAVACDQTLCSWPLARPYESRDETTRDI